MIKEVEGGDKGSVCPTLVLHHDSDGEWTSQESRDLLSELLKIKEKLILMPPVSNASEWVSQIMDETGLKPSNAYESFIDVDGEFLVDRLVDLAELSISKELPILFQ